MFSLSDWRTLLPSDLASSLNCCSKTQNQTLPPSSVALKDCLDPHTQTAYTHFKTKQVTIYACHQSAEGGTGVFVNVDVCVSVCVMWIGACRVPCAFRGHFCSDPNFGASTEAKIVETITELVMAPRYYLFTWGWFYNCLCECECVTETKYDQPVGQWKWNLQQKRPREWQYQGTLSK